jgi:hypothetical protein
MSSRIADALAIEASFGTATLALASTTNVPFTGLVISTCVLTVATPGVLAPNGG